MPVCVGCGGSYDDAFKFCPFCGRARPEPNVLHVSVTSQDVWEQCEIAVVYDKSGKDFNSRLRGGTVYFEALAIGPQGRYAAARSEKLGYWELAGDVRQGIEVLSKAQPKLDALIKQLTADGWQYIGRGRAWYNEQFRRRVST